MQLTYAANAKSVADLLALKFLPFMVYEIITASSARFP
jgi:hypothetical protein